MSAQASPRKIWHAGGFAARYGAEYLSVTVPTFYTIAREEKWPRKRVRGKVVYPKSLIRAYLLACPDAEPLGTIGPVGLKKSTT